MHQNLRPITQNQVQISKVGTRGFYFSFLQLFIVRRCMPQSQHGCQRTFSRNWLFPSVMWVLGIEPGKQARQQVPLPIELPHLPSSSPFKTSLPHCPQSFFGMGLASFFRSRLNLIALFRPLNPPPFALQLQTVSFIPTVISVAIILRIYTCTSLETWDVLCD